MHLAEPLSWVLATREQVEGNGCWLNSQVHQGSGRTESGNGLSKQLTEWRPGHQHRADICAKKAAVGNRIVAIPPLTLREFQRKNSNLL